MRHFLLPLGLAAVCALSSSGQAETVERTTWKLDFGGKATPGFIPVKADAVFASKTGYGFEPGSTVKAHSGSGADPSHDGFVTSEQPFLFSVAVPEGVYRVTAIFGDAQGSSMNTVKAEARRLMIEKAATEKGKFETRTFTVAVRRPDLPDGQKVSLKSVELDGHAGWDSKLTLEFSNTRPCLCTLQIVPAEHFTTIYIAGDSTVTDQRNEPYAGWGQMLPRFFNEAVAVANHAHSGLALYSFRGGKRLEKVVSTMQPGDYLFIQFGHNDQKDKSPGAGPFTSYKRNLKTFIEAARSKGGIPVLVTPMERRRFDKNGKQTATLTDYAEAVRQVGAEEKVPVIDLNAMSLKLYAALGPEKSTKAFVHYPENTFPGQTRKLEDDTHHNAYGAYELARCIVEGIKATKLDVAKFFAPGLTPYDPARPDPLESWSLPASPATAAQKPEGN